MRPSTRNICACLVTAFTFGVMMSGSQAFAGEITVSAAMSLKNAFTDIGRLYEAGHPGTRVVFNFGASGDLIRQIEGGAPVDLFASASEKEMDEISKKGLVMPGSRIDFAGNSLVLVVPLSSGAAIKGFEGLSMSEVGRIAIGNPRTTPAGRYAEEVFSYYRISSAIRGKLILSENVRQVLDYVARGEADAGVVYRTDALLRPKEVRIATVAPEASHTPTVLPIAVLRGTKAEGAARAFVSVLSSPEGKKALEKYGFRTIR